MFGTYLIEIKKALLIDVVFGGVMYFSYNPFIKFKSGLRACSNNLVELLALKCLLKLDIEK